MAFFWIFLKDRECTSERKTKSQAIANKMITFQIIDHSHCVSYLSCVARRGTGKEKTGFALGVGAQAMRCVKRTG